MAFRIRENDLAVFCQKALQKSNMSITNSITMSSLLVKSDMWGIYSHGTKNLYGYLCKADAKGVSFTNEPSVEKELPSSVVINGNNTMGFISGEFAMNKAIELARTNGIGLALVKKSCHFGAVGCYSNIAAEQGMIGFVASNVDKKMGIPGAKGIVMGNNPFSLAAPATMIPSIILDISSSNVACLKVLKAKAFGESIPDTWITDINGNPTTDPSRFPDEGALQPMGNHKGYGIAIFVEILTSVLLSEATSTSDNVPSWCFDMDKPNNICHVFIAINPQLISDGCFAHRVDSFIRELHNAPQADITKKIRVPGEKMWENFQLGQRDGLFIPDDVSIELIKVSKKTEIDLKWKEVQI